MIVGGGVLYIVGIFFFVKGNSVYVYHALWHMFVLIAACMHWFAVYKYVIGKPIPSAEDCLPATAVAVEAAVEEGGGGGGLWW